MTDDLVKSDWVSEILRIGASIPTPIALAGFGAACAFLIAIAVVRGIARRTGDPDLVRLIIQTLYRVFVCVITAIVIVVLAVSWMNFYYPVQSGKHADDTSGSDSDTGGVAPPINVVTTTSSPIPQSQLTADSRWIPGGKDPVSYCNGQQDALQKQFPNVHVETVKRYEFPPQKHKNGLGIVTSVSYRYQCWFKAS